MEELTLRLLRSLPENKASEEYAEFYIHDMNNIIKEYLKERTPTSTTEESIVAHDLSVYGAHITKDGKRIDPKDFYKPIEQSPRLVELSDLEREAQVPKISHHIRYWWGSLHFNLDSFIREELKRFGTTQRQMPSVEEISKVIQDFTNCESFTLTCSDRIIISDIAQAIHDLIEGNNQQSLKNSLPCSEDY